MAKKTIGTIVEKGLKRHKTEVAVLWLIIAIGAILIPAGIGVYFNVGNLAVTQYVSAITTRNFMIAEVRMLCNLARALGIIFSLSGIALIIMARERLSLAKTAHTMASHIQKLKEDSGEDLRRDRRKNLRCMKLFF